MSGELLAHGLRGQGRQVVGTGQVVQDDPSEPIAQELRNTVGSVPIREVPVATGDPLLEVPRIGPVPEHLQIVVGLDHQSVEVAKPPPCEPAPRPEVGREAHSPASPALDDQPHRLPGVVWNREGLDLEVADLLEGTRAQGPRVDPGLRQSQRLVGSGSGPDLEPVASCQNRGTPRVIRMLMGQNQSVQPRRVHPDLGEAPLDLLAGEPGIDQQPSSLGLDDHHVAAATRAQDGEPQAVGGQAQCHLHAQNLPQRVPGISATGTFVQNR